jgi:hypothetical protein
MPHILRFDFAYTVSVPAAPQKTVMEAGIEPGIAALQSDVAQWIYLPEPPHPKHSYINYL